jgi:hypothetical protein
MDYRKTKMKILTPILFMYAIILLTGCSSFTSEPVTTADSTIIYPSRETGGIAANITLCKKISKKSGKPVGEGMVFSIGENQMVRALVKIENRHLHSDRLLMFHIDWLDSEGNSFYMKRIDLAAGDTTSFLFSSISIDSTARQPGKYLFQVYYFRELIAEKKFELISSSKDTIPLAEKIAAKITFFGKMDKKTGIRSEEDTAFILKKKGWIHATVGFGNPLPFEDEELKFKLEWIGPDDSSFYRKQITLSPSDTFQVLNNSVSISSETRKPGNYFLRVTLLGETIAKKEFTLLAELPEVKKTKTELSAKISFGRNIDKKTGELQNEDTVFKISDKGKLFATVEFKQPFKIQEKEIKFKLDWIGPDGKSFYRKQIDLTPGDSTSAINSSILISPENRKPGKYTFRVFLFKDLIAEKKFELRQ